ncbi:MAG: hypothetical protein HDT26_10350 [Subdoligranulum sp.]|nr:hypothetical protein [Subdoligranulum sp.]
MKKPQPNERNGRAREPQTRERERRTKESHRKEQAGRAQKLLLTCLSRLVSAVRLAAGALLFTPLLALIVYVNYSVDCQGYFLGDLDMRSIAQMILDGKDIVGFDQILARQREVLDTLVANMDDDTVPETIALGSSRAMQLSQEIVGTSFYNSSTSGADFCELLCEFYIYDRRGRLPQNIIIGVDPWIFNLDIDAQSKRSDPMMYAEFVSERLGIPIPYETEDTSQNWQYLFDLSYFQGNLASLQNEVVTDGEVQPVPDGVDPYTLDAEIRRPDGSILYGLSYRTRPQEEIDMDILYQTGGMAFLGNYPEPDAERLAIFEAWIQYMQAKDINLFFFLAPYPPAEYDNALEKAEEYGGFLGTEEAVRALGRKYNIPVYGSYDPYAIPAESTDFYDGLHPRYECVARIFPGIPKALADRDAGIDVSLSHPVRDTAEDADGAEDAANAG